MRINTCNFQQSINVHQKRLNCIYGLWLNKCQLDLADLKFSTLTKVLNILRIKNLSQNYISWSVWKKLFSKDEHHFAPIWTQNWVQSMTNLYRVLQLANTVKLWAHFLLFCIKLFHCKWKILLCYMFRHLAVKLGIIKIIIFTIST